MPAVAKQIDQQPAARQQWRLPPPDPEGLQRLLVEMDRPLIDAAVRARLLRLQQFHGEAHIRLLIITITESEGNGDALIEPIVSAVSDIMKRRPEWPERGSEWLEAFDVVPLVPLLEVFRGLDAFADRELEHHYMISVGRRIGRTLAEKDAPPAPPVTNRVSKARRAIEQGLELLKHKGPHSTSPITRLAADRFGLSASECGQVINAAQLYGDKVWLVEKMSRAALFALSSSSLPESVRAAVERRLRAGEKMKAPEIAVLKKACSR
ncbi:hypothetical protein [Tardiphaga sp.]|uniref:hypothetical protein n=1 Tax=Tardiphaga sp. TaxID=1926292 RepID=UPI002634D127|nr:hypothetical protein [Tardiphaga sp.]MDB5617464.1 hypothetical protein [Tardiphaga sp.]